MQVNAISRLKLCVGLCNMEQKWCLCGLVNPCSQFTVQLLTGGVCDGDVVNSSLFECQPLSEAFLKLSKIGKTVRRKENYIFGT